ncbi:MAG: HAD-IA family hydrolase [Planctomycetota bacterium]|nr:HAD-IA family hydrolase [Planctomycetota bacterium]
MPAHPKPTPTRPELILLDVMSTLVYDPFRVEMPAFLGLTFEELLDQKHPHAWAEFEAGEIDEESFYLKFFRDGRALDGPGLKAAMARHYEWLPGMQEVLTQLSECGVPMHVLSNYPLWYEQVERATGLSRYVPWTFVSCHTGLRKPAPESFLEPARQLGIQPGACLLIDDNHENIAAAEALGMDAIPFQNAVALTHELATRGLLGE